MKTMGGPGTGGNACFIRPIFIRGSGGRSDGTGGAAALVDCRWKERRDCRRRENDARESGLISISSGVKDQL